MLMKIIKLLKNYRHKIKYYWTNFMNYSILNNTKKEINKFKKKFKNKKLW